MEFGVKRLGNWVITKFEENGVPWIELKPVNGEYLWRYSAMDTMFHSIDNVIDDENISTGLQVVVATMGSFLHSVDPIFYDLYLKCLEEYGKIAEIRKTTTREEERDIIAEMKVQYELEEALKKEEEWFEAPVGEIKTAADKMA